MKLSEAQQGLMRQLAMQPLRSRRVIKGPGGWYVAGPWGDPWRSNVVKALENKGLLLRVDSQTLRPA